MILPEITLSDGPAVVQKMDHESRQQIMRILYGEYGRIVLRELDKPEQTLQRKMKEGNTYFEFLTCQITDIVAIAGEIRPGPSLLEKIYNRFIEDQILEAHKFENITAKNLVLSIRLRLEAFGMEDSDAEAKLRESVETMLRVVTPNNFSFAEVNLRENAVRIEFLQLLKRELGNDNPIYKEARTIMDRHSLILIGFMHDTFVEKLKGLLHQEQQLRQELERKKQQTEQELKLAQRIQQSLLPMHFPLGSGLQFHARYLPMSSVGGDFYDVVSLSPLDSAADRPAAVIIADASGHGVPAAFIAAMTKMIWQTTLDHELNPAASLQKINGRLLDQISGNFITMFLAIFEPNPQTGVGQVSGGNFHFANGGHPAPILLRPGEPAQVLESRGRIIGIFPEVQIERKTIEYRAGDRFVFYTDGLIEARSANGEMLGEENLIKHLESTRDLSGNEFCDNAMAYYKESTSTVDDDVTLFVVDIA